MSLEDELNGKNVASTSNKNIIRVTIIIGDNAEHGSGFKKYNNGVRIFVRVTKNGEYSIKITYESRKSYGIWKFLEKIRIARKSLYEFCEQSIECTELPKEISVETPKKAIKIAKKYFNVDLPKEYIIVFSYHSLSQESSLQSP